MNSFSLVLGALIGFFSNVVIVHYNSRHNQLQKRIDRVENILNEMQDFRGNIKKLNRILNDKKKLKNYWTGYELGLNFSPIYTKINIFCPNFSNRVEEVASNFYDYTSFAPTILTDNWQDYDPSDEELRELQEKYKKLVSSLEKLYSEISKEGTKIVNEMGESFLGSIKRGLFGK